MLLSGQARADEALPAASEKLAYPPVSVAVDARSARGPWTLRVHNDGGMPVRIHADARLLQLLVAPRGKGYTSCVLPGPMQQGDGRELELKAGESYREDFDPRLLCFGKLIDQMAAGTSVTAFWGYKIDAARVRAKKPQQPPFAVEPAEAPPAFEAAKRLVSLTTWLFTPAAELAQPKDAAADKPAAMNTSRLVLDPVRLVDAPTLRDAKLSATVRNVGDRAALVHLRPDLLEFTVTQPDGTVVGCGMRGLRRSPVRDFFHTIAPKGSETLSVLLDEACPRELFKVPGVYEIRTVLHARWDGKEFGLSAVTGDYEGQHTTLVRVQTAKERYYRSPPQVEAPSSK